MFCPVPYSQTQQQEFPFFHYFSNCGMTQSWDECKDAPHVYPFWLMLHYFGFSWLFDPVFVASAFMVCVCVCVREKDKRERVVLSSIGPRDHLHGL